MIKFNESHSERFKNDKPDSLNKRPQKNVSTNNIRMRKFNDIRQYIGKKLPKSKKKNTFNSNCYRGITGNLANNVGVKIL